MSDKKPPEPGTVEDLELGQPGMAEPMSEHDADEPFETAVNDYDLFGEEEDD